MHPSHPPPASELDAHTTTNSTMMSSDHYNSNSSSSSSSSSSAFPQLPPLQQYATSPSHQQGNNHYSNNDMSIANAFNAANAVNGNGHASNPAPPPATQSSASSSAAPTTASATSSSQSTFTSPPAHHAASNQPPITSPPYYAPPDTPAYTPSESQLNRPEARGDQTLSIVWNFFRQVQGEDNKKLVWCILCRQFVKRSGNTSNMHYHLKTHHKHQYEERLEAEQNEPAADRNSSTATPKTSRYTLQQYGAASVSLEHQLQNNTMFGRLAGQPILSVTQFDRLMVDNILHIAGVMQQMVQSKGISNLLGDKLLTTIFYEPSTRTSSSFQAAMLRLGGKVLPISDVANSSVSKGETLTDTMHCLQSYSDVIVLRHPQAGSAREASSVLSIPLINAGDGVGEHPTQALLDLYTIQAECGRIDDLVVTMIGDLKHGRTVHSLSKVLKHYRVTINYVAPQFLAMPAEIVQDLQQHGITVNQTSDLNHVLPSTDVLYVTRIQKERFTDLSMYQQACQAYCITQELISVCKPTMRILHPLPRVNEIDVQVDNDPRAAYFRQMKSGLYVRMALLAAVLGRA